MTMLQFFEGDRRVARSIKLSRRHGVGAAGLGLVAGLACLPAQAQTSVAPASSPSASPVSPTAGGGVVNVSPGNGAAGIVPQTSSQTTEEARIDALRLRGIITQPSVRDTIFGNVDGFRSTLADYGIGFSGILSGYVAGQFSDDPRTTRGTTRYIGQSPELDSTTSYLGLTYDLSRVGLKNGLFTTQVCGLASTSGTYPHGVRLCDAYYDQPLFNKVVDLQIGYMYNNNQYANPLVGGGVSSGSLGPSASLLTEMGLAVGGVAAPGANVGVHLGDFYNLGGIQRSTSLVSTIYEAQVANPYGIRFNDPGTSVLLLDEIGYRHAPAPGTKQTWIRIGTGGNLSEYTSLTNPKTKEHGVTFYALADRQLTQIDPSHPRRGLFVGGSVMWSSPDVYNYDQYYELRGYGIGLIPSRPSDQISAVANVTGLSEGYQHRLRSSGYLARDQIYNLTLAYTYHVAPGIYLNGGLTYSIHPSAIYTRDQGNPFIFRGLLVFYL